MRRRRMVLPPANVQEVGIARGSGGADLWDERDDLEASEGGTGDENKCKGNVCCLKYNLQIGLL